MSESDHPFAEPWWQAIARSAVPAPMRRSLHRFREQRQLDRVRRGGVYEQALTETFERLIRPGMTVADVGANVGMHTLRIADLVGTTGHVFAFEAFPGNVERLRHHMDVMNFSPRVTVKGCAVTDGATDRIALHPGRNHSKSEWNIVGHDSDGNPTEAELFVPTLTLDRVFADAKPLHVVKIDVEGAEHLVLKGMKNILQTQRPKLVIEVHDAENWQACHELAALGYQLQSLAGSPMQVSDRNPGHLVAVPMAASISSAA